MSTVPVPRTTRRRHTHHDAPDTTADFHRLSRMEAGPARDTLRDEIVRAWMPMAARLARQFRNRGEDVEDLQQVAYLGLLKAVTRYDPTRACAFESYAVPTIVGEIKRHFRDHMWSLHVPRRVQELRNRVRAAHQELCHSLDDRPTVAQLATQANLTEDETRTGLQALESYATLSLDAELTRHPGESHSLLDVLGQPDTAYDHVIDREAVAPYVRQLPERQRRLLYLRYYKGMTQGRIARHLGISQMHVSRLLTRTCSQIRQHVTTPHPS